MSQYGAYQGGGQYPQNPQSFQSYGQPGVQSPPVQQQGGHDLYGNPMQGAPQEHGAPMQQQGDMAAMDAQMGSVNIHSESSAAPRGHKKKGRHAHHTIETPQAGSAAFPNMPSGGQQSQTRFQDAQSLQSGHYGGSVDWSGRSPQLNSGSFGAPQSQNLPQPQQQVSKQPHAPLTGTPASSTQGRVDPEQIPSIPTSRDGPSQFYLENVYPTMEQHLPPPASVPFFVVDQGNSSPKYARLTLNSIPTTAEALNTTQLPLGLVLQPLAPQQEGEQAVPVIDFGETGPPRCRRCRTYINPFMLFRSGGNKMVCNMCTFPNDVPPDYFAPTDPSGARVDRQQRPELTLGTVEFTAPKEYWTKPPTPLQTLFLIDVSMEAVSKGFLHAFCQGILNSLYGDNQGEEQNGTDTDGEQSSKLPKGSKIGIATFDKEVHFYSLAESQEQAHMVVMPDSEDPFVPISDGLFVDPHKSKSLITNLLKQLPEMFVKVKNPEPALLPALNSALDALKATGGKVACSIASLPTWGPGRLFLREKPEMRETEAEKKLFTTEHPGFLSTAAKMTENGIGCDFFLAAPQGGYLDIATIGMVSEKTGGELFYYPNFHNPRDNLRLSKEISRILTRDSGFQALIKVRCSNGLQVSSYFGNFTQHTFGADLEMGAIDADKAVGVIFSYDGKLDPKLDAHFQSAVLYTTATGERRIRCSNIVASVSESGMEAMKLVDQDAVVTTMAKQAVMRTPDRSMRDIRAQLTERTIDILAAYRKNFSGSHPPGQLVLPENLKEFSMYMLGLIKSRALKAGQEPTDRRVYDMHCIKAMGCMELSLYLYPRVIAIHSLGDGDGFPNASGHLQMPPTIRASYSRIDEGGAYLIDSGSTVLLWLHASVSPNLLEDLFGPGHTTLQSLDPFSSSIPVLETHLNAQVRNILQYLEDNRGSKGLSVQLARQGLDGAEYEFARLLYEDRNGEAQSYVDWLVHVHRHIQLELQGQRKKEDEGSSLASSFAGLRAPYW